jgi:hypothetical protein
MEALAVAAEAPHNRLFEQAGQPALYVVPGPPDITDAPVVRSVRETEYEPETQMRFKNWLGTLATNGSIELSITPDAETEKSGTNLLEQIKLYKYALPGSPEAVVSEKMIKANIATATAEVGFKKGHITTAVMEKDGSGDLVQHGHTNDSIQRNAMTQRPNRHPALKNITKIEALNAHRIKDGFEAGQLTDNYFVVASLVPQGVPEKNLGHKGDGYFLREMTFVVQATTEQNETTAITKSAFMAGVEAEDDDSFEDRMAKRFDITVLQKVYERLEQDPPQTVEEFLDGGLLIPKSLMPNGIADFLLWCAEAKDELDGITAERTVNEFMAMELESKRREASLQEVNQKVFDELIASEATMRKPMDAVQAMWESIRTNMTENSFTNEHLDPKVFGAAAPHIIKVREYIQSGDTQLAQAAMHRAIEESEVTGCGGGSGGSQSESAAAIQAEIAASGTDKFGHLKFTCEDGHLNEREPGELLDRCGTCGKSVSC